MQELYLQEFEQARIEYNAKQTRNDRRIDNYFKHISDSDLWDLVCEFVVEFGDKDFWQDKDDEYRKKMSDVYNEPIKDLMDVVPAFIEKNYNNVIEENGSLKTKLKNAESKITELEEDLSWKDKLIDKLQAEKQKFENLYYKFSGFWHSIIKRFQGMIGYYEDKNYKNVAKDLYEHDVIDMKEYEIMFDRDKPIEITDELQSTIKNRNDKVK